MLYNDICREIEILELRLDDLMRDRQYIIQKMHSVPSMRLTANYDGMPGAGFVAIPLNVHYEQLVHINGEIAALDIRLQQKRETKRKIEHNMSNLETIEGKVLYMFEVEKKPLYKIADELGLSYAWIRKLNSRSKKAL